MVEPTIKIHKVADETTGYLLNRSQTANYGVQAEDARVCIAMVGLPARGKSYTAQKLTRWLHWLSIPAQVFNVGMYRRKESPKPSAEFFDPSNPVGERLRRAAAENAINDMVNWFRTSNGVVAILDATNSTKGRREWIRERCGQENIAVMFVESICNDQGLIMSNIRDVKTTSPDYAGMNPEKAASDFLKRIEKYRNQYETIDDEEGDLTYVKMIDVGAQIIVQGIQDMLQTRVVYFLMNLHIRPRTIWLSRHGESEYNLLGKLGGDIDLSPRGEAYARALPGLVQQSAGTRVLTVWTSTLKRTIQTARFLPFEKKEWKALDELDSGICDGMTYAEVEATYPEDFKARDEDKYRYRYIGGESYQDVVVRLEPIIMELERNENILIVTHQAVLRCIYAYFMNMPQDQSPWMEVPLHTLIQLTPRAYNTEEKRWKANIPAVSTWRPKGSSAVHQSSPSETPGVETTIVTTTLPA